MVDANLGPKVGFADATFPLLGYRGYVTTPLYYSGQFLLHFAYLMLNVEIFSMEFSLIRPVSYNHLSNEVLVLNLSYGEIVLIMWMKDELAIEAPHSTPG